MRNLFFLLFISFQTFGQIRYTKDLDFDLIHTELNIKPIWKNQTLEGTAKLTLKPYFYPQNKLVLNAKNFKINSILLYGEKLNYAYNDRLISIDLAQTFTAKDSFQIVINYVAQPNQIEIQEGEEDKSEKGLYFINANEEIKGLPKQLWTQGETQSNSSWFPTIDHPNQNHTQDIFLEIDKNLVSLSNGVFKGSKDAGNGFKIDHWSQNIPHAVYLSMIAVGDFVKVVDPNFKRFEVSYYMEPEYAKYADGIFGRTPEMINYFEDLLGVKFPWQKYAQIPIRKFISGAMENTTATTHAKTVLKNNNQLIDNHDDAVIAHELFHHWFGNYVTNESWSYLTLNEAFANYSEYLWINHKYGKDEGDYVFNNDLNTYLGESESKKKPLVRFDYLSSEDMFDAHSYQKGGRVLHTLRQEVGDKAFFEALNLYLKENAFKTVETSNLRLVFEKVTGRDLKWFFDQWFDRAGHPVLDLKHTLEDSKLILDVQQAVDSTNNQAFRVNLPIRLVSTEGVVDTFLVVKNLEETFSLPFKGNLINFIPNAEGYFLGIISDDRQLKDYVEQGKNNSDFYSKIKALEAGIVLSEVENPLENDLFRDYVFSCLSEKSPRVRQLATQIFYDYDGQDFLKIEKKLEGLIVNDPHSFVRADAIIAVKNFKNPKHLVLVLQAMKDTSYSVRAMALEFLIENEHPAVDSLVKIYENVNDGQLFAAVANYFVASNNPNKLDWMLDRLELFEGIELYQYIGLLGSYLVVNETDFIEQSLPLLRRVSIDEENWFNRMAGVQVLYVLKDLTPNANSLFEEAVKAEKNPNLVNSYKQFNVE